MRNLATHAGLEITFSATKRSYTHVALRVVETQDGPALDVITRFGRPELVRNHDGIIVPVTQVPGETTKSKLNNALLNLAQARRDVAYHGKNAPGLAPGELNYNYHTNGLAKGVAKIAKLEAEIAKLRAKI
jgi:hypothetical protein